MYHTTLLYLLYDFFVLLTFGLLSFKFSTIKFIKLLLSESITVTIVYSPLFPLFLFFFMLSHIYLHLNSSPSSPLQYNPTILSYLYLRHSLLSSSLYLLFFVRLNYFSSSFLHYRVSIFFYSYL